MSPEWLNNLTDEQLHFERAKRHLGMQRLAKNCTEMERLDQELAVLDAEDRRRHSIFINRNFRGGV